jgi:hypothetical protein
MLRDPIQDDAFYSNQLVAWHITFQPLEILSMFRRHRLNASGPRAGSRDMNEPFSRLRAVHLPFAKALGNR